MGAKSWLFHGRSGSGKTTLAGSFPKDQLYLDVDDQGTDSISDLGADIQVLDVNTSTQFEDAYWYLVKNPDRFKTVVIDTLTNLQQLRINHVLEEKGVTLKKGKRPGDWGSLTEQDWGEVSSWFKTWITNYRNLANELGIEVVFLCQERLFETEYEAEEDDDGNLIDEDYSIQPEISPRLMPSVVAHINAQVQVIGSTFISREPVFQKIRSKVKKKKTTKKFTGYKMNFCLRIGPSHIYMTKVRKPKGIILPPSMVDPTYKDLCSIIKGD